MRKICYSKSPAQFRLPMMYLCICEVSLVGLQRCAPTRFASFVDGNTDADGKYPVRLCDLSLMPSLMGMRDGRLSCKRVAVAWAGLLGQK